MMSAMVVASTVTMVPAASVPRVPIVHRAVHGVEAAHAGASRQLGRTQALPMPPWQDCFFRNMSNRIAVIEYHVIPVHRCPFLASIWFCWVHLRNSGRLERTSLARACLNSVAHREQRLSGPKSKKAIWVVWLRSCQEIRHGKSTLPLIEEVLPGLLEGRLGRAEPKASKSSCQSAGPSPLRSNQLFCVIL